MNAALLLVKSPSSAKARLAPRFDSDQRRAIAEALLEDALALASASPFLEWWVTSDDDEVLERARGAGLQTFRDDGSGLNEAIRSAVPALVEAGADSVCILPSDLPLAEPADLEDLLDTAGTSDVVVVPSLRDGGTNALALSPPGAIDPAFGEASLSAHVRGAEGRGIRCSILPVERLELDIDTPEDVDELMRREGESATAALLRRLSPASPSE